MACRIVYSTRFQDALDDLMQGAEGQYSKWVAKMFFRAFKHHKNLLLDNPRMGAREPLLEDVREYEYRHLFISPYFKVIYCVFPAHILLVDMWDTRRDPAFLISHLK